MRAENPGEVDYPENEGDQKWSENGELDQVGPTIICTPTHAKKAPMPEIARKSNSRPLAFAGSRPNRPV
jgi:hypothetical protein